MAGLRRLRRRRCREENVVHDLEHGTVWISYDPDLADDDVAALAELLPQNGILAPYPGLKAPSSSPSGAASSTLDGADDPRLALFIKTYGGGETAPEPSASCAGGTGTRRAPVGDRGLTTSAAHGRLPSDVTMAVWIRRRWSSGPDATRSCST